MPNARSRRVMVASCCATVTLYSSFAHAGLFRAYLSASGKDTNPCTVQQPCRLLPAALTAVSDGGEIWMLDSANYNTAQVDVAKSVTILAVPGAVGSIVATLGGSALVVSGAGISVTLRNLVVTRIGSGNDGIGFMQGAALSVEDCEISNMTSSGIAVFDTQTRVSIRNSVLRNNHNGFYARGPVTAVLDRVHSEGNANAGVYADANSSVTVNNSVLAGNHYGGYSANDTGVAGNTFLTVSRSLMTANLTGLAVTATAGSGAWVYADGNAFSACNVAFEFLPGGGVEFIQTFRNNTTSDCGFVSGGVLSTVSAI